MARASLEVIIALGFSFLALETYAHRSFSQDHRYRVTVVAFAVLAAYLGFLPLLVHFAPRVGRIGIVLWLSLVVILLIVGFVTKPKSVRSGRDLSPNQSLERANTLRVFATQRVIRWAAMQPKSIH